MSQDSLFPLPNGKAMQPRDKLLRGISTTVKDESAPSKANKHPITTATQQQTHLLQQLSKAGGEPAHTSNKLLSRAMRFRMHHAGNFNKNEKKENKQPSHFLSPLRNQGPQPVFTYSKKEPLHQMMFYDFFCGPAETQSSPFSTIIFYYRHGHDITSTEKGCSSHCFHCITVINGDLNTLTQTSAFLFVYNWSSDSFHSLISTRRFIPGVSLHTLMCDIPVLIENT